MRALPGKVAKAFEDMKARSSVGLQVKILKNRFCVFGYKSKWDKALKRPHTKTWYLGRIKDDGTFVPTSNKRGRPSKAQNEPKPQETALSPVSRIEGRAPPDEHKYEHTILRVLSMNGRAPAHFISGMLKLSSTATSYQVKNIEERYDIKYTAEIDTEKLGYLDYIAFIKFVDDFPTIAELKESLENEPRIQLVALTKGEYDVLVYILAEDNEQLNHLIYRLKSETPLKKYVSHWVTTPFYPYYGFVPIRSEFFGLLKGRVWHRSKGRPRPAKGELTTKEYDVLKDLCENGDAKFTDIDEKHGFRAETANNVYYKLLDRSVIKRTTITMGNLPIRYNAIIFMEVMDNIKFDEERANFWLDIIADTPHQTNKFVLEGDIQTPYSTMLVMPVYGENMLQEVEEELRKKVSSAKLTTSLISGVIVGRPCYRKFDNRHTVHHYDKLVELYSMDLPSEKIDYGTRRKVRPEIGFRGEELTQQGV